MTLGNDGALYGYTTYGGTYYSGYGTIFKITTNGVFASLYSFTGGVEGKYPILPLAPGFDGNIYGTQPINGGTYGYGSVFKITSGGDFTNVYSFTGGTDGTSPGILCPGSDGNFYGWTGHNSSAHDLFEITTNGTFSLIVPSNSSGPWPGSEGPGMIQGGDGNFYFYDNGIPGNVYKLTILPKIGSAVQVSNMFAVSWNAFPGQSYQIQYVTNLVQTNWSNLGSAFVVTNSTPRAFDSMTNYQRYYRLLLLLQ